MVKFSRGVEEEEPKRTCICTSDARDLQCKQHGG